MSAIEAAWGEIHALWCDHLIWGGDPTTSERFGPASEKINLIFKMTRHAQTAGRDLDCGRIPAELAQCAVDVFRKADTGALAERLHEAIIFPASHRTDELESRVKTCVDSVLDRMGVRCDG